LALQSDGFIEEPDQLHDEIRTALKAMMRLEV
jgi:hypothetical protein